MELAQFHYFNNYINGILLFVEIAILLITTILIIRKKNETEKILKRFAIGYSILFILFTLNISTTHFLTVIWETPAPPLEVIIEDLTLHFMKFRLFFIPISYCLWIFIKAKKKGKLTREQ